MTDKVAPTVLAASDASDESDALAVLSVFTTVAASDASVAIAVFLCCLSWLPLLPCLQLLHVLQVLSRSHWLSWLYCVSCLRWPASIEVVVQLELNHALLNAPFVPYAALDTPSRIRPHRPHIALVWPPCRCALERGGQEGERTRNREMHERQKE